MKLTQGDAKATVKRRGFLNWDVEIIRPGYQVIERTFDTYQGAIAFEIWTGAKAPVNVMRKALKEALK